MVNPTAPLLCALALLSATVQAADSRSERSFNINGKVVSLTPQLLQQFRGNWKVLDELRTVIPKADAQWALDFISISAFVNRQRCAELEFKETARLSNKEHTHQGALIKSGRYDELWRVLACGSLVTFRVVEPRGSGQLMVYEVDEKAF